MVVFKVDPTKIVIPVMHFGESKETILTFDLVIWSFSALKDQCACTGLEQFYAC